MTIILSPVVTANVGLTFLQLVQRLRSETKGTGSGPTTTVGQTGEYGRMVKWINDAWLDIQTQHEDWGWMRTTTTFTTQYGLERYTTAQCNATNFSEWVRDSFRCYVTASGTASEMEINYIDYDVWRDRYFIGSLRDVRTQPVEMSIAPDKSICLGPVPNSGYTILGDYFTAPTYMSNDSDIPVLPPKYHMAIVWKAMVSYGEYEEDAFVIARAERRLKKFTSKMAAERTPEIQTAPALA